VTGTVNNEGTIILSAGQALSFSSMLSNNVVLLQGGVVSGAVGDDGTIQGFGTVHGLLSGGGYVEASGGWHAPETAGGHGSRWTNGAGVLAFEPLPTAAMLDSRLGGAATYVVEDPPARLCA
jgi:hypothetical protein